MAGWPQQAIADVNGLTSLAAGHQAQVASNFQNMATQFPGLGGFPHAAGLQLPPRAATSSPVPLLAVPRVAVPPNARAVGKPSASKAGDGASPSGSKPNAGDGRRKWAPNRKAAGFWAPFNDWWRKEFDRLGRRPSTEEVSSWYVENADAAWKRDKPSMKETRRHAKCLRTTKDVRNYFRKYRAKRNVARGAAGGGGSKRANGAVGPSTAQAGASGSGKGKAEAAGGKAAHENPAFAIATGLYDTSGKFNPATWMQQGGAGGALIHPTASKIGAAFAAPSQSDVFAMYRAAQMQAHASPFAFMHPGATAVYQTGMNFGAARNLQAAATVAPSAQHVRLAAQVKKEGTGASPNSTVDTDTTELVERPGGADVPTSQQQQQQNDAACLSSMISHIEKARSLANTPNPVPWRAEVSSPFQDVNTLEMKLQYEPTAQSIHIPAEVVDFNL
mmetsp:Transcript_10545/g.36422  ORF Transcript_10545/g.36422 Transcript_10545/m.36422 type:complete len:446 (-) Transcript_10545:58-1395(-)